MRINKENILKMLVLVLVIMCFISFIHVSNAAVEDFSGNIQNAGEAEESIKKLISTVLDVIRTVGIAIAIVMLVQIATKYIMASAGERADIKKYAFNYVIGAIVLFGAAGITTIIKNSVIEAVGN